MPGSGSADGAATPALRLLDGVTWRGTTVPGERSAALLAALVLDRSVVSDGRLVDVVWEEDRPVNASKALQVQVSRVRSLCGPDSVVRGSGGYRLGLPTEQVDALLLQQLVDGAEQRLGAGDPESAAALTERALELAPAAATVGRGPLAEVHARASLAAGEARRLRGLALARCGRAAEALGLLVAASRDGRPSPQLMAELLRAEATVSGVPAALERFESYRLELRDRLGVDADESLQRVHRELLAADEPVRTGLHYDAEGLLGRDADLARLRAAVRAGRLTSIIGPGGIGKTRVAHVLAREATQSRVHFVELVGVTSAEDLLAEVGAALGVRGSLTGHQTHSAAQRADIRGRIAQELDTTPTLLVLDNCEHLVGAVASLVAFLLVTVRDLRVVTTSRAPLNIAAERVVLLEQLAPDDGAALFVRRARSARPSAELDPTTVADVVERLDGLPLALELAAARIRSMSLAELSRRLQDRFALLRGGDRAAPARHQTLTAVIAWSWDLLSPEGQRALARLSVFQDGFGSEAATALLGHDALDLVEALVDQSLLKVVERDGDVRYRMLETVREFGTLRLQETGARRAALEAQAAWAVSLCARLGPQFHTGRQIAAVEQTRVEENNLADVLRTSLVEDQPAVVVRLLSTLGLFWAITGNHARVFALSDVAERVLVSWDPPPELVRDTQESLGILLSHLGVLQNRPVDALVTASARLGRPEEAWARATYAMFVEAREHGDPVAAVLAMGEDPDPAVAVMGLQWAAVLLENAGGIAEAIDCSRRALSLADDRITPWQLASLHAGLALLTMHTGDHAAARPHAETALPLLLELGAHDDALQIRGGLVMAALMEDDLELAERLVIEIEHAADVPALGGQLGAPVSRAELALARGDVDAGLASFDRGVAAMRAMTFAGVEPTGLEPWTLTAEAAALMAHSRFGRTPEHAAARDALALLTMGRTQELLALRPDDLDLPASGMSLAALAHWLFGSTDQECRREAITLVALAEAFSYSRMFPVMARADLPGAAESAEPGRLDALREEYAGRPGRELLPEAAASLARVGALVLRSSG